MTWQNDVLVNEDEFDDPGVFQLILHEPMSRSDWSSLLTLLRHSVDDIGSHCHPGTDKVVQLCRVRDTDGPVCRNNIIGICHN